MIIEKTVNSSSALFFFFVGCAVMSLERNENMMLRIFQKGEEFYFTKQLYICQTFGSTSTSEDNGSKGKGWMLRRRWLLSWNHSRKKRKCKKMEVVL